MSTKNSCDGEKSLWDFFVKLDSRSAKCSLCLKTLLISNRSTTGLKGHLQKVHCISVISNISGNKASSSNKDLHNADSQAPTAAIATTSKNEDYQEVVPSKKTKKTIDSYFEKENSMEGLVTRMVCKDGFSLSTFCTSSDLRLLFAKSGFQLPTSPNTIRAIIYRYADNVQADFIKEFTNLKQKGQRFSLSFDEWTSQKNHRYINLNLHHDDKHFNLGLIRIHGSCTAEHCIELVSERLNIFGLVMEIDTIGITTDGASLMVKVGKLLPCYQQLCYAHGIQLAVVDVLYKKKPHKEVEQAATDESDECEDDEDLETENTEMNDGLALAVTVEPTLVDSVELIPRYSALLMKVRKVVKLFKKSPTKDDLFLQKYVKEEKGKELSLILDCRTRWNSLLSMLERFYDLKVCIDKALIDVGSEIKFSGDEWSIINELIVSLQPLKLAVEALCRRESTLITADTTLKFVLDKLYSQGTTLSAELAEALRNRIAERRLSEVTGTLVYLKNPKKYEEAVKKSGYFPLPKKNAMRQEMKTLLKRVNKQNIVEPAQEDIMELEEDGLDDDAEPVKMTLEQELEMELKREKENFNKQKPSGQLDYEKVLKKEMSVYETEGVRGEHLSMVYDYLMTLKPTSVEAERAFSAAGYICSSVRSRLGDKTIDKICFLRSYFQRIQ